MLKIDTKRSVFVLIVCAFLLLGPGVLNMHAEEPLEEKTHPKQATEERPQRLFSIEFRDADLKDVLRVMGQQNQMNIIIGEEVQGKVTLSFQKVGLFDALEIILKIHNLTYFQEGDIIRIVPSAYTNGDRDLLTKTIALNYSKAQETSESLKGLLSSKGSISFDERTNTLIVRDIPENVRQIITLVKELDSKTPQVLIEARIVEAHTSFSKELGVQWGGSFTSSGGSGSTTLHGGTLTGSSGLSGAPFAVNLPAAVGSGVGGALGISFANFSNTRLLDIQLSALEDSGRGRILSNPKILTLDNMEARISTGQEILIPTSTIITAGGISGGQSSDPNATSSTTGVATINAKLELIVTPHVTPDQKIILNVKVNKKDPDYSRLVGNLPPLMTRTVETNLLVSDGETVVIGGIYTRSEAQAENGVPWFSKIPVLGWLFKKELRVEEQSELLIFITPTIVRD